MKFYQTKLFKFFVILLLFCVYLFITAKSYANSVSTNLTNNIFRLHIIANSDSDQDQELKLKVRDSIIEYVEKITSDCQNKDSVISIISDHKTDLYNIANQVIKDNGYEYSINIEIGNFYFPTKYYGNISLPSGYYDALKIEIGKANRSKLVV